MPDRAGRMVGSSQARTVAVVLVAAAIPESGLAFLKIRRKPRTRVGVSTIDEPAQLNDYHLELPPNRWHDAGDERFRPGNILVSARHLNAIFIIDKTSGEVVWQFTDECRELLIPPGATVRVAFGIDEERLQGRRLSARFQLTIAEKNQPLRGVVRSFARHQLRKPVAGT